ACARRRRPLDAQLQVAWWRRDWAWLVPRAALAASPWRDEVATLALADFQPEVHLWLVNAQNLRI
ncbi:hypothetical protein UA44_23675, partial [Klebsiella aerogenes]